MLVTEAKGGIGERSRLSCGIEKAWMMMILVILKYYVINLCKPFFFTGNIVFYSRIQLYYNIKLGAQIIAWERYHHQVTSHGRFSVTELSLQNLLAINKYSKIFLVANSDITTEDRKAAHARRDPVPGGRSRGGGQAIHHRV